MLTSRCRRAAALMTWSEADRQENIGEGINKVIAKLAAANNLRGVIDKVSFNDPDKLGKGDEMVKEAQ